MLSSFVMHAVWGRIIVPSCLRCAAPLHLQTYGVQQIMHDPVQRAARNEGSLDIVEFQEDLTRPSPIHAEGVRDSGKGEFAFLGSKFGPARAMVADHLIVKHRLHPPARIAEAVFLRRWKRFTLARRIVTI
jgi:hypothetical protein